VLIADGGVGVIVAGLGARRRCSGARGVPGEEDDGAGEEEAVRVAAGCMIGMVSARSTMVLKESINGSQAISDLRPAPEFIIMWNVMADIFSRVFPA
jgi:hypothetical protein